MTDTEEERERERERKFNAREKGLSSDIVQEHGLELARNVGINSILAHPLVMLQMVLLHQSTQRTRAKPLLSPAHETQQEKRGGAGKSEKGETRRTNLEHNTVRHPNPQIRNHRQNSIHPDPPKSHIVADLMNGQEQILVGRSSDYVGREEEFPGEGVDLSSGEEDGEG